MNKELCIQSYTDIVDFSARLAAYSTSQFPDIIGHGHYESRAKQLAIRDIILLCISVRRITELTKKYDLLKNQEVPGFIAQLRDGMLKFEESDKKFNSWEIIGNIIHAKTIDILKDDVKFSSGREPGFAGLYAAILRRKSINGVILIESDRGDLKYFEIYKFIKIIVSFTSEIDDFLAESSIFVGEIYE